MSTSVSTHGFISKPGDKGDAFPTVESLRAANETWAMNNAKDWQSVDADDLPLPSPARDTKDEIFKLADYAAIDDKACKAPRDLLKHPLADLVKYLVNGTKTELERVRVIYRWITAHDLSHLDGSDSEDELRTPLDYLVGIKSTNITYHRLMEDMCSQADIRTRCIEGYSKHSKYEPGDQLAPADRSSWTAVLVDNTWRLLDINWSSKYVSGERHEDWKLIDDPVDDEAAQTTRRAEFYQHDETYFLTSPEVLVYSHLPDDERWQLLARPVTRQEFVSMAHLSGHFFRYGLRLASHRQCEVWAKNGEVTIKLGLPSGAKYKFAYRLWVSTRDKRKMAMYKDTALKRYVFMYHANGLLQCKIQFPVHGKFKLELSCLDRATTPAEQHYTLVCAYIINVYQAKKDVKPLPENNRDEWGPGCDLDDVGINPVSHTDGAAQMDDAGEIAMAFVARKDIEFLPTLHSNGRTKEQMHDYMCYGIENGRIAINAKAPEAGQYALNLYARQRGAADDSGSMPNVCSYLLFAPKPAADPTPFPAAGLLWASDAMVRLGVQTVSHPSAYVKLSSTDRADFVFGTPVDRDFMASLTQHRNDAETDMEEFCMVDKRIDKVTIRSRFPSSGLYKLDVFGKDIGQGSATTVLHDDSFAHIFTYVIAVDRQSITDPCCPFPEVFGEWTEYGCELHEPEFGSADLYAGSTVSFSVRVPTAKEVVFIRQPGDHWMPLTCGNTGLWIGNLETGEAGDEVQLSAKFDDASTHFSTLMIFKVSEPLRRMTKSSIKR